MKKIIYIYFIIVISISIYLIWFLPLEKKYYSLLFVLVFIWSILPKLIIGFKKNQKL
jgi:hypothetical protein